MRNGQSTTSPVDLEIRFGDMFHAVASFPPPEPFKGFVKIYSSRNGEKTRQKVFLALKLVYDRNRKSRKLGRIGGRVEGYFRSQGSRIRSRSDFNFY